MIRVSAKETLPLSVFLLFAFLFLSTWTVFKKGLGLNFFLKVL